MKLKADYRRIAEEISVDEQLKEWYRKLLEAKDFIEENSRWNLYFKAERKEKLPE